MYTQSLWASVRLTANDATPYTGGPYAPGDYIRPYNTNNGLGLNPITNEPSGSGHPGGGTIASLVVVDNNNQGAPLDFYVFTTYNWTAPADNAPFTITDLSADKCCGMMSVKSYVRVGPSSMLGFAVFPHGPVIYKGDDIRTIYMAIVARGSPTYGPYPLDVRLGLYIDGVGPPLG